MAPTSFEIASLAAESILTRRSSDVFELPGEEPQYRPPLNYTPLVVDIVALTIVWCSIALRFYVRGYMIRAIGWDDITMIVAALFFSVYTGADIRLSLSRVALEFMTMDEIYAVCKAFIIIDVFYCATQCMLKISVGIFLLRIIIKKHQRWVVYAVMALCSTWSVATMFFAIFQCGAPIPASLYVEKRIFGLCVSDAAVLGMTFTLACVTALTDFTYTTLPIFILRDAKMNKRAKISLGVILALGGLGSIASLVRFKFVSSIGSVTNDFFIQTSNLAVWSTIECALGITAGSIATLRPLFKRFLGAAKSTISHTRDRMSRRYSQRYSQHTTKGGSPRSSRGGSQDFGWAKHFKRGSSDLEIGCRGESPLTPIQGSMMSEVYDGKSKGGLGTETTITVGLVKTPEQTQVANTRRLRGSGGSGEWPGVIETETTFETMSEKARNSMYRRNSESSGEGSEQSEKVERLPKAWLL